MSDLQPAIIAEAAPEQHMSIDEERPDDDLCQKAAKIEETTKHVQQQREEQELLDSSWLPLKLPPEHLDQAEPQPPGRSQHQPQKQSLQELSPYRQLGKPWQPFRKQGDPNSHWLSMGLPPNELEKPRQQQQQQLRKQPQEPRSSQMLQKRQFAHGKMQLLQKQSLQQEQPLWDLSCGSLDLPLEQVKCAQRPSRLECSQSQMLEQQQRMPYDQRPYDQDRLPMSVSSSPRKRPQPFHRQQQWQRAQLEQRQKQHHEAYRQMRLAFASSSWLPFDPEEQKQPQQKEQQQQEKQAPQPSDSSWYPMGLLLEQQRETEQLPPQLPTSRLDMLQERTGSLQACSTKTRSKPATGSACLEKIGKDKSSPPLVERCEVNSPSYIQAKARFEQKWQTSNWGQKAAGVLPPNIVAVFKLNFERPDFSARQHAMRDRKRFSEYAGEGNCLSRFHGTRITCNFNGTPCDDVNCGVCCILKDEGFRVGNGSSSGTATYGLGIYFTSMSHSAKGYGLAEGKQRPPHNLKDFVSPDAGNAVFIADVLAGHVEKIRGKAYVDGAEPQVLKELDRSKFDSRCINKKSGNDELVIPQPDQAKPTFLLLCG